MRAWQLLACIALANIAVSAAFSLGASSHEAFHEADTTDMEVAASKHHEHHHSSGFEEDGGSKHGEDHHKEVK